MLKQPEPASSELTARMLEYLEEHMKSVHNAVMGISGEDYQKYIDVDSWIDYIIIQEITKNIDGNFKTSCYLYKQSQDDRLYMTAIWDFDIAFGLTAFNNASAEHNDVEDCVGGRGPVGFIAINSSAPWFNALYHNYPDFQARFKQRYKEYRSTLIPEFFALINEQAAYLYNCTAATEEKWEKNFDHGVNFLTNWLTGRIEWLDSQGAFNHPYWMCKCSWSYGNNKIITDTGCGTIHLAGCVIEVMGNKGAMTIRVTTPSTSSGGGITNAQFTYINHGDAYAPGWRRDYNTKNLQPAFALGQTGNRVANDKAVGWNWNSGVYDADLKGASTLILHFNMNAGSCPAVQLRVNYKNGGIYYRSARDGYGFEADWSEFYTTTRKPSAGDVGAYTQAECNSRFITGIRLGGLSSVQTWNGPGWSDRSGYVVTGSVNGNRDELIDTTQARPIQYCINGTWYNAGSI